MMIRIIGAIFIVVSAYVLGVSKQKNMILSEKITGEFSAFFEDLKNAIGFSSASIPAQIIACSQKEYLNNLTLLEGLSESSFCDKTLSEVLCDRLDHWEYAARISKDERSVVRTLFQEIGRRNIASEQMALAHAGVLMTEFQKKRTAVNEKRKGFFEAVFTLAGIAVAIILL